MKHNYPMKAVCLSVSLGFALAAVASGCSHTLAKTEQTKVHRDGSVTTKQEVVTQNADGTISKSESVRNSHP
jgi:hypothetical protein